MGGILDAPGYSRAQADDRYKRAEAILDEPSQFTVGLGNRTGSTTTSYVCIGTDGTDTVAGRMYFGRAISGSSGIVQSDDIAATFSADRTLPAGVTAGNVASVVEFDGNVYMLAIVSSVFGIYRAPIVAQGSDWSGWSSALHTMTAGSSSLSTLTLTVSTWGSNDALFLSTYGDPKITGVNAATIWRSTDGTTWTATYGPDSTIRHIHHVWPDTFVAQQVWMSCGDGISKSIQRSTDGGLTWEIVVASGAWQAVQISGTETDIWFARDSSRATAYVLDRATLTPRNAGNNYHHYIPPPHCAGYGYRAITDLATTAGSAIVSSATAGFRQDDRGHYVQSNGLLQPGAYIVSVSQLATISGSPTGGTWTLGPATGLAHNITAAAMATALNAAFSTSGIAVTLASSTYTIVFPSTMGNVAQMATTSALTGGTAPTTTSKTAATLQSQAINSASGNLGTPTTYLGAHLYCANAFHGAVDPDTGIYYCSACDTSGAGQVIGLFYLKEKGGDFALLDPGGIGYPTALAVVIHAGYMWCGSNRYKLLTKSTV